MSERTPIQRRSIVQATPGQVHMNRRIAALMLTSLTVLLCAACDSCGGPPGPVAAAPDARDFLGRWEVTVAGNPNPIPVTIRQATNKTPTSPGELCIEGTWQNMQLTGTAEGDVLAGSAVSGNSAIGISMRIVEPGQATGTFTRAMGASSFVAVRMGAQ